MLSEEYSLAIQVKMWKVLHKHSAGNSSQPYTEADVCSAMRYHWKLTLTQ